MHKVVREPVSNKDCMCCANRNQINDKFSSAKAAKQQQVAQERQDMANARAQMEAEAQW